MAASIAFTPRPGNWAELHRRTGPAPEDRIDDDDDDEDRWRFATARLGGADVTCRVVSGPPEHVEIPVNRFTEVDECSVRQGQECTAQ